MVTCATCGTENPPGSRFCNSCGAALAAEAPPAREERKVVTVLFCDLVGFTSRAERLDPEDVHAVLGGYHERVRRELERYGGTVEKFIGDAVMALFGAPVAHEDDPERAVRAALAIREDIGADDARADGRDLHVRVGITTGEALVNLSARAEAGEAAAAGDVVNTAARLQAAAAVDGILVDEPTFRATERVIAFDPAPPVTAKGKAEPVAAWTAREAKARLGMDVAHTATSELVGRKHEVGGLREALARVRRERSAQLVTLVGVPGIGKSRLVHELLRAVDDDPELIVWRQGRSLPYGTDAGYWALGEMVKAQAGILETDDDDAAAAKLAAAVRAVMPEADDTPWVERHLRPLAGLGRSDASGEVGRDEAFAAWRRFWEALADSGPTVLVFEDLHWADDGLLDFVDHLADWATSVPLLLVCTARPELLTRRPGWGGGKPNASTLSLAPLSDEDTARLVLSLLDTSVLDAGVQSALLARAGGNPLYAEEFVRMTQERGLSSAPDLPETVQGIIAARLDGLDPEAKGLIQDAAVVGKVFWLGALTAVGERDRFESERQLHELERRQLVRRERRSSVGSEVEYAFWHVLVRDVAYGQIPRSARADKHRATAEWIGSLARDRVADQAELIAHHYVSALELARAAGRDTVALERPAREALRAAGERALALHSFAPAARFFEQALALWPEDDAERADVLFGYGRARFAGADEGRETLEEARDLFLAAGDAENAAAAETMIGELAWILGRPPESLAAAERAAAMLADRPPSRAKAYAHASRVRYLMLGGRDADAIEAAEEALELAERIGDEELRASVLNSRGTARANLGDRGGVRDLEQSIEVAERVGSPEGIRGYINLASTSQALGEFGRGAELHERGLELAHRFGQARGIRFLEAERSYDLFATGQWDEAERTASEFIREVEAGSPHYQESQSRGLRAWIAVGRGDDARALADTERLLEQARELREPQVLYPALAWGASFLAALGREERSRALMDELLGIDDALRRPTAWAMTAVEPVARFGLEDRVLPALDAVPKPSPYDEAAALYLRGRFAEAADVLEATGFLVLEAHVRTRAAEAAVAAGRRAEADAHLARAISFYRAAGATRFLRDAEALLAASA